MKLGSLFDGIGGFPLAGQRHGITPVWASEIEKNPVEITKKHFPNMKHLGDITKINGAEIEPVDVITFGSPCQDLSVAGKRAGLEGERSGLFMEAVRIIREMRGATNGKYPRFAVWENVPGAFSSAKGNDFRAVLEEITESKIPMPNSGKWATSGLVRGNGIEAAWRVLDAQYWGVPQRRKRIFLVADFRGTSAAEILFVEKGLRGYSAKSRKEGQGITRSAAAGAGGANPVIAIDAAITLGGNCTAQGPCVKENGPMWCLKAFKPHAVYAPQQPITLSKVSSTLRAGAGAPKHEADEKGRLIIDLVVAQNYKVRRLTPTECERLQGFPDGWTDEFSDTARYKALGNSVAVPCVEFVLSGIANKLV